MYDYSIEIQCIRNELDHGESEVNRIRNKLGDLESDIMSAIKSDNLKIRSGSLDLMELTAPVNDVNLSSADNNLYHELDELRADIIEEQMRLLQENV